MPPYLGRGTLPKVNDENDIERNSEYETFVHNLTEFHLRRGTPFQPEPVVGHRKISLLRLYRKVLEKGGFDEVTEEKGAWRGISDTYDLPASCTNGGFQLKTHYYKYLAAYELYEKNLPIPPPQQLEFLSAKGPGIASRMNPAWQAANAQQKLSRPGTPVVGTPDSQVNGRSLRTSIQPRQFYSDQSFHSARRNSPATPPLGHSGQASSLPFGNINLGQVGAAQRQQQSMSNSFPQRSGSLKFGAGLQGSHPMNRLSLGLRSGLPQEVDYSLIELLKLSSSMRPGDLVVEKIPYCGETLLSIMEGIFALLPSHGEEIVNEEGEEEVQPGWEWIKPLDWEDEVGRILRATLVVRNCVLEERNASYLARLTNLKSLLSRLLALDSSLGGEITELKGYAIEISESTVRWIEFISEEEEGEFYDSCVGLLRGGDRGRIIGGLKILARMALKDPENRLLQDFAKVEIERIVHFLLLDSDEQLLSAVLDFLFQWTSYRANIRSLKTWGLLNFLVERLLGLVADQGQRWGKWEIRRGDVMWRMGGVEDLGGIPPDLPLRLKARGVGWDKLGSMSEPERCIQWVRTCYQPASNHDITQVSVWKAYQERFHPYSVPPWNRTLLQPAEMIKNVSVAWREASAVVYDGGEGKRFTIRGVRPREEVCWEGKEWLRCKWNVARQDGSMEGCGDVLEGEEGLWGHIVEAHVKRHKIGDEQQIKKENGSEVLERMEDVLIDIPDVQTGPETLEADNGDRKKDDEDYTCHWSTCSAKYPSSSLATFLKHVRTHIPIQDPSLGYWRQGFLGQPRDPWAKIEYSVKIDDPGKGVSVTAGLVLRNLAGRLEAGREELERALVTVWGSSALSGGGVVLKGPQIQGQQTQAQGSVGVGDVIVEVLGEVNYRG